MNAIGPGRARTRRTPAFDWLSSRILLAAPIVHASPIRQLADRDRVRGERAGGMTVERDIVYRDLPGDRQALDLYRPVGPVPEGGRPVLLAIHGGGWARFDKGDFGPEVAAFTREGYLVVAPNYTLSRPGKPSWPVNLDDLREAVRWMRTHASTIGADPRRIAALGESAGGHLAEILGTYPGDPQTTGASSGESGKVNAVVSLYGPSDLRSLARSSPVASRRIRGLLGANRADYAQRLADASPQSHVTPDDAPMMLIHGRSDTLVPASQSIGLARRLRAVGVSSRLVLLSGEDHGFGLRGSGRNLVRAVGDFLRQALR